MRPTDTAHSILCGLDHEDRAEFEALIEQAITAAVAEDRATRECCKLEREACAQIARIIRINATNERVRCTSEDIEALILARSPTN